MTTPSARSVLARLRRGETLAEVDLAWFAQALGDGRVSDAQAGAFAMAVCRNGLNVPGRIALTRAMRDSGTVLAWDLDRPVIDKHSTGGIGDCVSLVLAPALAACGAAVPMISGPGLGHTGGTLDKLEAIPGVNTQVDTPRLRAILQEVGCAIVGASERIAPADRKLYAVRDVTSTVDSLDLITASILSKKLAAGLDGLVLDVKTGSGAFMKRTEDARALAQALVQTANAAGCRTAALITDMNQPLVPSLGNALEVAEAMRVLTGQRTGPLLDLSAALGGVLLAIAGLARDRSEGERAVVDAVAGGEAADRFGRMVAALGGPSRFVENWEDHLPKAPVLREVTAESAGHVAAMDGEALGLCVVALGGGRTVETDRIDPAVGLSRVIRLGEAVAPDTCLALVHAASAQAAEAAVAQVRAAITLSAAPPSSDALIRERIG